MLDVLRQGEAKRDEAVGVVPGAWPVAEDFVSDLAGGDVPFIEVGPARSLEGSEAVLAAPATRLRLMPQPPPDAGPVLALSPSAPAPARVGVCLRPLPAGLALRPPLERFAPELVAFHHPDHPGAAEYRQLAAALVDGTHAGPGRVLVCAGAAPGVGATSVVLNLGVSLTGPGDRRVVIVDAAAGRPAVAERLGLRGRPGLAEVLAGSESLDRALQETGCENLSALTAGQGERGRPACAADAWRPVLRLLRDRFDVVLIDGGADPGLLGDACDAVYLVMPHAQADAPATIERLRGLLSRDVPVRGCILTRR